MLIPKMYYHNNRLFTLGASKSLRVWTLTPLKLVHRVRFNLTNCFWHFLTDSPELVILKFEKNKTYVSYFNLDLMAFTKKFQINEIMIAITKLSEDEYLCVTYYASIYIFNITSNSLVLVNNSELFRKFMIDHTKLMIDILPDYYDITCGRYYITSIDKVPNTNTFILRAENCCYLFDLDTRSLSNTDKYRVRFSPILIPAKDYIFSLIKVFQGENRYQMIESSLARYSCIEDKVIPFKKGVIEDIYLCGSLLLVPYRSKTSRYEYIMDVYDCETLKIVESIIINDLCETKRIRLESSSSKSDKEVS
jgi:hypothetical protein